MNFTEESESPEFDFPLVPTESKEALSDLHNRALSDYTAWKRGFLEWLYYEGKKPDRFEGFAHGTIKKTSYKTGQIMRWLWDQRGYTTELRPDDADDLMRQLGRHSTYKDSNLSNFVKVIKRIFSYYNHEKGKSIEWSCNYSLSEPNVTNRDYFKQDEFRPLYEAALSHGTVKHYHNCTVEERNELKGHLATRYNKPKDEVTPHDFERANSFKIPSIVSTSLDMGLRPVEITRARAQWIDLDNAVMKIPAEESSKNEENWECVLSDNSVRSLGKWIGERATYDNYEGTNALWLNKRGNPYNSQSLNYLLDQLIKASGIEPAGRELSWYSIRHGVATLWADTEDIQDAQEQLRHKRVETTLGYSHSSPEKRHSAANNKY